MSFRFRVGTNVINLENMAPGADELDELIDVDVETALSGSALVYNGAEWLAEPIAGSAGPTGPQGAAGAIGPTGPSSLQTAYEGGGDISAVGATGPSGTGKGIYTSNTHGDLVFFLGNNDGPTPFIITGNQPIIALRNQPGPWPDVAAEVRLFEASISGDEYVGLKSPASLGSSYTLTLPTSGGNSGELLTTDGSGILSWTSVAGPTGPTGPAGPGLSSIVGPFYLPVTSTSTGATYNCASTDVVVVVSGTPTTVNLPAGELNRVIVVKNIKSLGAVDVYANVGDSIEPGVPFITLNPGEARTLIAITSNAWAIIASD
jgi:hypothetical protein